MSKRQFKYKKHKNVYLVMIVIILISTVLSACKPQQNPPEDPIWGTPGFTLGTVSADDMFKDLIDGTLNTVKPMSKTEVSTNSPFVGMNIGCDIEINSKKFKLSILLNYDHRNMEKFSMAIELNNATDNVNVLSFRVLSENNVSYYLMKVGETKFKVSATVPEKSKYFPLNIPSDNKALLKLAFVSVVKIENDKINYEFKNDSNVMTRHYNFDITLKETLLRMYDLMSSSSSVPSLSLPDLNLNYIYKQLLGVSVDDIRNGKLPSSNVTVDFTTIEGKPNTTGYGKVSSFNMSFDIAKSDYKDTIFNGEAMKISIKLNKLLIDKKLLNVDPNANININDYPDYKKGAFKFLCLIQFDDGLSYDTEFNFVYDNEKVENTKFKLTLKDALTKAEVYKIDLDSEKLTIIGNGKTIQTDFDTKSLLGGDYRIENNVISIPMILSYCAGSFKIDNLNQITLGLNQDFYNSIVGINTDLLVKQLYESASIDLKEELLGAQLDFDGLFNRNFKITVSLDTQFLFII